MVARLLAILAFLIFTLEATPYTSIVTFGSSKTVIYALLIGAAALLLAIQKKIKFPWIILALLALAVNELIVAALNNMQSINFVRITAACFATLIILSSGRVLERMTRYLMYSHALLVIGFLFSVIVVFLLGSGVLHSVFPLSDPAVFRKLDYAGAMRIRSFLFFNFTLNATPDINIFDLNVLPSGSAAEPHAFFSFILVCTLILWRGRQISWPMLLASAGALLVSYSTSNGIGLLGACAVTSFIYAATKLQAPRVALSLLALASVALVIYLWRSGYLLQENVTVALAAYDRSVAESYATIARFFALGGGSFPLEAVPNYFNDFRFLPLSPSSVALFTAVLSIIFVQLYKVARRLEYIEIFLLSYVFAYSIKSFGVTIFQPYLLISILLVLYGGKSLGVSGNKEGNKEFYRKARFAG